MIMFKGTVLCVPRSEAVRRAAMELDNLGIHVTNKCGPDVTHLLLSVPSFSGGDEYLAHFLAKLPENLIVSGGNLDSPLLEGYACVDFLQDPYYLAENAAITARCAVDILENHMGTDFYGKQTLVIGWGRIGKCLVQLLNERHADVTVAARKDADLAMIQALGTRSTRITDAVSETQRFDMIINTVPVLLFPDIQTKPDALLLELASKPGMTGASIIDGRGLPGKLAPVQSGKLIAETFIRLSL